jgi:CubicO group peptidase (beta-lactamase class C family)
MNRFQLGTTSAGLLALVLAGCAAAQQTSTLADSTPDDAVRRVFAEWSPTTGPGCAVAASRNGEVIYQAGFGSANLEMDVPITPSSIFHVASISKQFTAAAVMLLARDGQLTLDDDVRRYIPELPDYGHTITIRHLLTHTSGLRDQWDLLFMARGRFEENRITEDDVLEIAARQTALNFVPGSEYLYSNTGYTLAGTIVRRVSGQTLREFADRRIFQPLGMEDTHFHDDYTMIVRGRAAGYAPRPGGGWRVSLPNYDTYGATSLFTTVGDLLKWDANFANPVVGDAQLLREMLTSATLASGDSTGYGLGISTDVYRGARLIGHGGADAGYRTYLGRFPDHDLTVVVLCNAASANPSMLARSVADVYLQDGLEPVSGSAPVAVTVLPEQLVPLVGVYANATTGAPLFITMQDNRLILGRSNGPQLVPLGDNRFRVAGQPVELEFGEQGDLSQTVLGWPNRAPINFSRREMAVKTAAELERYAGSYHSEELGAVYTVRAGADGLVLKTRWGAERSVRPAYGTTFAGDMLVTFTTGSTGEIDGMRMSSSRVRDVAFQRQTSR